MLNSGLSSLFNVLNVADEHSNPITYVIKSSSRRIENLGMKGMHEQLNINIKQKKLTFDHKRI